MGLYSSGYRNRLGSGNSWSDRAGSMGETYSQPAGGYGQIALRHGHTYKGSGPTDKTRWDANRNSWVTESEFASGTSGRTGGSVGGSTTALGTELASEVHKQRAEADKKREEQKKQALLALQKGLMSEEQYQSMMTGLQVDVEHGTERAAREMTESAYGQVNIGAVRAGAADIRQQGRETLARGRRDIGIKRQEMAADVGRREADIHSRFQVPRMDIPAAFTEEQALIAMRGEGDYRAAVMPKDWQSGGGTTMPSPIYSPIKGAPQQGGLRFQPRRQGDYHIS